MRKARSNPKTRRDLLRAAQRIMLAKGYVATTLDEICAAAGVTKGSFFHYFAGKEDLGKAALHHFMDCQTQAVQGAAFLDEVDPLKRLHAFLDFMIEMAQDPTTPKSCLVGNFAQELSETHPALRAQCAQHFAAWTEGFKRELDAAKVRYAPAADFDTASVAEHLLAVVQGSLILTKAKQDPSVIEQNLRHFKRYLQSLFEQR